MSRQNLILSDGTYFNVSLLPRQLQYRIQNNKLQIKKTRNKKYIDADDDEKLYDLLLKYDIDYYREFQVERDDLSISEMVYYNDVQALREHLQSIAPNVNYVPQFITKMGSTLPILKRKVTRTSTNAELLEFIYFARSQLFDGVGEYDYFGDITDIDFLAAPVVDVELPPLFNGNINCVIKAVLPFCRFKKDKTRLLEFERLIRPTGANVLAIKTISDIIKLNISIRDITNNQPWVEFLYHSKGHGKHLILYAHNQHCFSALNKSGLSTRLKTEFVDELNLTNHPNAYRITKNKTGDITSIMTDTHVYKTKFDEYELYPKCYSDSGVGRAKFLEQFPEFRNNYDSPQIFKLADRPGLYVRTAPSSIDNVKYDQNQSFRAFDQSGCFNGFPTAIDQTHKISPVSLSRLIELIPLATMHGLLYVKTTLATLDNFTTFTPIYYDKSGFYDIHICLSLLKDGIDPIITGLVLSKTSFYPDFSSYTKQQFRAFIGRTTSKHSMTTFITTNTQEALHLLYKAGSNLAGSNLHLARAGQPITIDVDTDSDQSKVWQLVQVGAYVKQHQKLQLFRIINTLFKHKIKIINITTDSIEVSSDDSKLIDEHQLLKIHPSTIGYWKKELVNPSTLHITSPSISIDDYFEKNTMYREDDILAVCKFINILPTTTTLEKELFSYPQLLFITGSAGTGKTQRL